MPKDNFLQRIRQCHGGAVFIRAGTFRRNLDRPVAAGNFDALIRFILSNINSGVKIRRTILPADGIGLCFILTVFVFCNLGILDVRYLLRRQDNFAARAFNLGEFSQVSVCPILDIHQILEI